MKHPILHEIKKFFKFTKSEQRGVTILLFMLLIILIIYFLLVPAFIHRNNYNYEKFKAEIDTFKTHEKYIDDSINIENLQNSGELDYELAKRKLKPFPFNPNKLPEELWLKLGLSKKQVQSIKKFEAKGGKFLRKEDLKKMYLISDVEYKILAPFIKIPNTFISEGEHVAQKKTFSYNNHKHNKYLQKTNINRSDSITLTNNLGLSPWLAARVIKYKHLLGGYFSGNQLAEVYGMSKLQLNKIINYIIIDTTLIKKIDINNASFKDILRHPYFDYQTTKRLIKGRKTRQGYNSFQDVKADLLLNDSIFKKLKHYLYLRPLKKYNRDE